MPDHVTTDDRNRLRVLDWLNWLMVYRLAALTGESPAAIYRALPGSGTGPALQRARATTYADHSPRELYDLQREGALNVFHALSDRIAQHEKGQDAERVRARYLRVAERVIEAGHVVLGAGRGTEQVRIALEHLPVLGYWPADQMTVA